MSRVLASIGSAVLALCREIGGMVLLLGYTVALALLGRFDRREFVRSLYKMGVVSVPIVAMTALFTGGTMVIQSGIFVQRYQAYGLLGWGTVYAVLREVGPILIGLMFSGRVGANNAADLGTMVVTDQVDGLRALSIQPIPFLIVPRVLAMVAAMFCLLILGDAVAIVGGMAFGKLLLGVDFASFWASCADAIKLWDLTVGLIKGCVFALLIAITSAHYGLQVQGGAVGVGRAVNDAVVAAALLIMISDDLLTMVLR
ncbi:MAG TPA: ABC transporter permease [Pseudomonadota bacterium]|nr:ABC transporter permease [Pseudomonadota bacterium]